MEIDEQAGIPVHVLHEHVTPENARLLEEEVAGRCNHHPFGPRTSEHDAAARLGANPWPTDSDIRSRKTPTRLSISVISSVGKNTTGARACICRYLDVEFGQSRDSSPRSYTIHMHAFAVPGFTMDGRSPPRTSVPAKRCGRDWRGQPLGPGCPVIPLQGPCLPVEEKIRATLTAVNNPAISQTRRTACSGSTERPAFPLSAPKGDIRQSYSRSGAVSDGTDRRRSEVRRNRSWTGECARNSRSSAPNPDTETWR